VTIALFEKEVNKRRRRILLNKFFYILFINVGAVFLNVIFVIGIMKISDLKWTEAILILMASILTMNLLYRKL